MFKHHKYCVVEAAGLLVAVSEPDGTTTVYLLDNARGSAALATNSSDANVDALSLISDKNKRVRITDPALIDFVCHLSQRRDAEPGSSGWSAQVAGTVDMEDGEARLSYVSQAFIHDQEGLLKYEPH